MTQNTATSNCLAQLLAKPRLNPKDRERLLMLLRRLIEELGVSESRSRPHHKDTSSGSLRITWLEGDGG
jgi:hypothetical protein